MKDQYGSQTIPINSWKCWSLALRQYNDPENQTRKQCQDKEASQETPLFTDCAKNKIGALFRHKIKPGLGSLKKTFSKESARTNGYLRLVQVVTDTQGIAFETENGIDTRLLMGLQNIMEYKIDWKNKENSSDPGKKDQQQGIMLFSDNDDQPDDEGDERSYKKCAVDRPLFSKKMGSQSCQSEEPTQYQLTITEKFEVPLI